MLTVKSKKKTVSLRLIYALCGVLATVALPQLTHFIGWLTGTGGMLSVMLCPMHLPVILVGLVAGPLTGAATGVVGVMTAFAITGMPQLSVLPFMTVELFAYGLIAGLLSDVRMYTAVKTLVVQIAGRAAYIAAVAFVAYVLCPGDVSLIASLIALKSGALGAVAQIVVIPLLFKIMRSECPKSGLMEK